MTWKRFQTAVWVLLALCAGGWILIGVTSGMGFMLVIGPVDSTAVFGALLLLFLLALLAWGDGAVVVFTKGWVRGLLLAAVLAAEGFALSVLLFFWVLFDTGPEYIPLYAPTGEVGLVVRQESWLFSAWGEFYRPAGPCLLRSTGVTYQSHDIWPFHDGCYEIEWAEDQAVIRYNGGMGGWETCTVPRTEGGR